MILLVDIVFKSVSCAVWIKWVHAVRFNWIMVWYRVFDSSWNRIGWFGCSETVGRQG